MAFNAGAIYGTATINDKNWTAGLSRMSKGAIGLAVAVGTTAVVAMVKATKAADEWGRSIKNVSTLIDTNVVSTTEMSKALLQLDPKLGKTTELTDAMYQAFSAGALDMDDAIQITSDSAKFAKAALTDTFTAVDVLTTAVNAYGRETMSTTQASDIFFKTIEQGKITGSELSSVIGQSIPLFASMKIPLEDLGSGLAAMTKQGVASAEATTQLNALVNSFIKPSTEMSDALLEIGYSSGSAFLEAEGLTGALDFLQTSTNGNKDALSLLVPNIRAFKGAMALTGEGGKIYNDVLIEMENSTNATNIAFEKQFNIMDAVKASSDKLKLVLGNLGLALRDQVAKRALTASQSLLEFAMSGEAAELVGDAVAYVSGTFQSLKDLMKPITETLGPGFNEIFTAIKDVMGELFSNTGDSSVAMDALAVSTNLVASGFRVGVTLISGMIRAIGDLIDAIKLSGQTIGDFFQFLGGKKSWAEVKDRAYEAGDAFKVFGKTVYDTGKETFKTVIEEAKGFKKAVEETSSAATKSFETTFTNTKSFITNNWDELITGQTRFSTTSAETIEGFYESWKEDSDLNLENELINIETAVSAYESGINDIDTLRANMQEAALASAFGAATEREAALFSTKGYQFAKDVADGIMSLESAVYSYMNMYGGAYQSAKDKIKGLLEDIEAFEAKKIEAGIIKLQEAGRTEDLLNEKKVLNAQKTATLKREAFEAELAKEVAAFEKNAQWTSQMYSQIKAKELQDEKEFHAQVAIENSKSLASAVDADQRKKEHFEDYLNTKLSMEQDYFEKSMAIEESLVEQKKSLWQQYTQDWEFNFNNAFANVTSASTYLIEGLRGLVDTETEKGFEQNKQLNKLKVTMDAASSIMGWWKAASDLGPIAGPIFAGAMTGATLALAAKQISAINSQSWESRQYGGMASGLTRVNEVGGEIINLPDNSLVIPHDISTKIANSVGSTGSGGNIYISFEGANFGQNNPREISDVVSRELARQMRSRR